VPHRQHDEDDTPWRSAWAAPMVRGEPGIRSVLPHDEALPADSPFPQRLRHPTGPHQTNCRPDRPLSQRWRSRGDAVLLALAAPLDRIMACLFCSPRSALRAVTAFGRSGQPEPSYLYRYDPVCNSARYAEEGHAQPRHAVPVLRHVAQELLKGELEQHVLDAGRVTATDGFRSSGPP